MSDSAEPLCRLSGVKKSFGSSLVLGGVDLQLMPGDVVALVGQNGAGKSTLLRIIAGLMRLDDGTVEVSGEPVNAATDQPEIRRRLAYVGDQPALFDDLTLRQQASFVGRAWGMSDWSDRTIALAAQLALDDRLDDQASTFSKGMRQKSGLLLAFLHPAAMLLLDEPFSGLDSAGQNYLTEYLGMIPSVNTCALVSTHAMDRIGEFATRAVQLHDGMLTELSIAEAQTLQPGH